ncbi:hypothetical protein GYB62_00570 [bacterium]|nr:hypothetical protein [bacterium]
MHQSDSTDPAPEKKPGIQGASAFCAVLAAQLEIALEESKPDFHSVMQFCIDAQQEDPRPDLLVALQYRDRFAQRIRHICDTLTSLATHLDESTPIDFINALAGEFSSIRSLYSGDQVVNLYAVADQCCEASEHLATFLPEKNGQEQEGEISVADHLAGEFGFDNDSVTASLAHSADQSSANGVASGDMEWF